jgi:hypothetical protein
MESFLLFPRTNKECMPCHETMNGWILLGKHAASQFHLFNLKTKHYVLSQHWTRQTRTEYNRTGSCVYSKLCSWNRKDNRIIFHIFGTVYIYLDIGPQWQFRLLLGGCEAEKFPCRHVVHHSRPCTRFQSKKQIAWTNSILVHWYFTRQNFAGLTSDAIMLSIISGHTIDVHADTCFYLPVIWLTVSSSAT